MIVLPLTLLVVLLTYPKCSSQNEINSILLNHSYAFISGWAQSGTSFVHQILDQHALVSSMIQQCEVKLGKRCVNWNHEGQWILKGSTRLKFKSGFVCLIDSWDESTSHSIRTEWTSFWDLSRPVLVEKSPQSLLKFPALYQAFRSSQSHPATLNIATPRTSDWTHYRNNQYSMVEDKEKMPIDSAQKLANIAHFSRFMLENASTVVNKQEQISLGWLPGMEQLTHLLNKHNWTRNAVRIVRYEEFYQPSIVCKKLFDFVFRHTSMSMMGHDGDKVCAKLFHQVAVATSSTPLQTTHSALNRGPRGYMYDPRATTEPPNYRTNRGYSRGKTKARAGTRKLQTHPEEYYASLFNACEYASMMHRQLRLRSAPTQPTSPSHAKPAPFVFRPDLVQSATKERMVGFANTYSTLPGHLKEKMQHVNDRLLPFGYDLFASYFSPDAQVQRKKFNALTAWEL